MPQLPRPVVKARAERLRAKGAEALRRHLDRQVDRTVKGLVERPGVARAADFTEVLFDGAAQTGGLATLHVVGHDGRRALARLV